VKGLENGDQEGESEYADAIAAQVMNWVNMSQSLLFMK